MNVLDYIENQIDWSGQLPKLRDRASAPPSNLQVFQEKQLSFTLTEVLLIAILLVLLVKE